MLTVDPDNLSVKDAVRADVSTATIHRYIQRGALPAVLAGKRHEVAVADLDRVLAPQPVVPLRNTAALITELERAAERVAKNAPPLSAATRQRLRDLLGGVL